MHLVGKEPAFLTIVARNYTGMALTLAESVRRHHPDVPFYVFLLDDLDGECGEKIAARGFLPIGPASVDIAELRRLLFQYDVTEACTAIKPFILRHLFSRGHEKLIYLDPDIWCLGPLTEAFDRLEDHDLVLTPHVTTPIPEGAALEERLLLQVGAYNLGFLGLRKDSTASFLEWWGKRLLGECLYRLEEGLFFDQKWIDLAHSLGSQIAVLRHRGYNLAWWNAHERTLVADPPGWKVRETGEPLVLMHFSALPSPEDGRLSRNVPPERAGAGYTLLTRPDLAPLFSSYRAALVANDDAAYKTLPYAYGCFYNGRPIRPEERERYRRTPALREHVPDPFALAQGLPFDPPAPPEGPKTGLTRSLVRRIQSLLAQPDDRV